MQATNLFARGSLHAHPTDTGPCNQAIPASALRNGTDRPQPPVPVPVGPLPAHCVLPERNDGPVILDDVVVVLAIWGQGLGRPRHWRSPDRGNTRGGWLGRRAVSPRCLLLTLQPRSAPAPRPAPPSQGHALEGHALSRQGACSSGSDWSRAQCRLSNPLTRRLAEVHAERLSVSARGCRLQSKGLAGIWRGPALSRSENRLFL